MAAGLPIIVDSSDEEVSWMYPRKCRRQQAPPRQRSHWRTGVLRQQVVADSDSEPPTIEYHAETSEDLQQRVEWAKAERDASCSTSRCSDPQDIGYINPRPRTRACETTFADRGGARQPASLQTEAVLLSLPLSSESSIDRQHSEVGLVSMKASTSTQRRARTHPDPYQHAPAHSNTRQDA